jgi:hypothetical protein
MISRFAWMNDDVLVETVICLLRGAAFLLNTGACDALKAVQSELLSQYRLSLWLCHSSPTEMDCCSSTFGGFLQSLIGLLIQYDNLLMCYRVPLDIHSCWLYCFRCCFLVGMDVCDGLHNGADVCGILELRNEDPHGRDYGLD